MRKGRGYEVRFSSGSQIRSANDSRRSCRSSGEALRPDSADRRCFAGSRTGDLAWGKWSIPTSGEAR